MTEALTCDHCGEEVADEPLMHWAALKAKLGEPVNGTRFAPACVDCTVAQAKHFNYCPWCGESLK